MSLITEINSEINKQHTRKFVWLVRVMKSEKIRSKLAALLLILVLAASITACSGSKNTETGEDSTPSTEETVDTEAPEELESGQDIPEGVRETEEKPN